MINNLPRLINTLKDISSKRLIVGYYQNSQKGRFLNMIAMVQETGAHIKPKPSNKSGFLWIPTSNAKGRKASEIPHLYVRGHAAGVDDESASHGFRVYFILKKSVDIPPRPFIRTTVQRYKHDWATLATQKAYQAGIGEIMLTDYYKILGQRIRNDLIQTAKEMMTPHNAPLTVERKGDDNPLIANKRELINKNNIEVMAIRFK